MPPKRKSLASVVDTPPTKRLTRSDCKSSITLLDREDDTPEGSSAKRRSSRREKLAQEQEEEEHEVKIIAELGSEAGSPMLDPFTPTKRGHGRVTVQYGRKSGDRSGSGRRRQRIEVESSEEEQAEELPESPTKGRKGMQAQTAVPTPPRSPKPTPLPSSTRSIRSRRAASPTKEEQSSDDLPLSNTPSKQVQISTAAEKEPESARRSGRRKTQMEVEVVIPVRRGRPRLSAPAESSPAAVDAHKEPEAEKEEALTPRKRKRKMAAEEEEPETVVEKEEVVTPRKGRRKVVQEEEVAQEREKEEVVTPKRGRGRPRKVLQEPAVNVAQHEAPQEQEAPMLQDDEEGLEIVPDNNEVSSQPAPPIKSSLPSLPMPLPTHLHPHLLDQQRTILSRLHEPTSKPGEAESSESAISALVSLLRGTVERGEGNSCLVLGPRGTGKTRAVELALEQLPSQPIVVRLSGLTHPDDRSALRELQRQVLSALGQRTPSPEPVGGKEEEDDAAPFASLPSLPRPLVVLLSDFDVFCMRPRQALLYVLLDAVQSLRGGSGGIAVVGMTARIDCVNLLEKRVKSRFSHRIIRITPAQSVDEYINLTRTFLLPTRPAEDISEEKEEWDELWKKNVEGLLADKQARTMLRHTWELVHDLRLLQRILTDAVARLSPEAPWLTPAVLQKAIAAQRGPHPFPYLSDLSAAALGLLIAVYQVGSAGHDVFTFQQLEHTYRAFARDHSSALGTGNGPAVPREGLLAAFDDFVRTKVFTPAALPFAPAMREFSKYRCAVDRREIEEAVRKGGSTGIRKWLKQWSGR